MVNLNGVQGRPMTVSFKVRGVGVKGPVRLSLESTNGQPLPTGLVYQFGALEMSASESLADNILMLNPSKTLPEGQYSFVVRAAAGALVKTQTFLLDLGYAGVKVDTRSVVLNSTVYKGAEANFNLPIRTSYFQGRVTLALEQANGANLPQGLYAYYPKTLEFVGDGLVTTQNVAVKIKTPINSAPGTYALRMRVIAQDQEAREFIVPVNLNLTAPSSAPTSEFELIPLDFDPTVRIGEDRDLFIDIARVNYPHAVQLSVTPPANFSGTFLLPKSYVTEDTAVIGIKNTGLVMPGEYTFDLNYTTSNGVNTVSGKISYTLKFVR